jgi:hypothetical protein
MRLQVASNHPSRMAIETVVDETIKAISKFPSTSFGIALRQAMM